MSKISVVIPVYNVEGYLCRCLDSVLSQTFKDFELILVDDGSMDNCGLICDEYANNDERITVLHQENQGQAKARNVALDWIFANSKCEYITFIDSDDWVHPQYLELLYKANELFGTSISQCLHIETDGAVEKKPITDEQIIVITAEKQYIEWYSAYMWGKLYSKSVWKNVRFSEGHLYEDVEIWYKILFSQEKISLVKKPLYYYFINMNGTVRSDWTPAKLTQVEAWDAQINFFSEYGNQRLLDCASEHMFQILRSQQIKIQESKEVSQQEKKKYTSILRQKLRLAILRFWRTPYYRKNKMWIIEGAYPSISWLYWTFMRIKKRIL